MTGREADEAARYWMGYALSMARRPAPLYSMEDWRAEALLGLAKALRDLPASAPRPVQAAFIKRAVGTHLAKARRDVKNPPPGGEVPRSVYDSIARMDEPQDLGDGEWGTRHDTTPDPRSPDPAQMLAEAQLRDDLRTFGDLLGPAHQATFGFLLRGLTPSETAAITGRTEQAEADRRLRVRRKLSAFLEVWGR